MLGFEQFRQLILRAKQEGGGVGIYQQNCITQSWMHCTGNVSTPENIAGLFNIPLATITPITKSLLHSKNGAESNIIRSHIQRILHTIYTSFLIDIMNITFTFDISICYYRYRYTVFYLNIKFSAEYKINTWTANTYEMCENCFFIVM